FRTFFIPATTSNTPLMDLSGTSDKQNNSNITTNIPDNSPPLKKKKTIENKSNNTNSNIYPRPL
ncbi:13287_t:CDS:1, partial [Dentiscutata heterogama]